jgi:hypothetical protein
LLGIRELPLLCETEMKWSEWEINGCRVRKRKRERVSLMGKWQRRGEKTECRLYGNEM